MRITLNMINRCPECRALIMDEDAEAHWEWHISERRGVADAIVQSERGHSHD